MPSPASAAMGEVQEVVPGLQIRDEGAVHQRPAREVAVVHRGSEQQEHVRPRGTDAHCPDPTALCVAPLWVQSRRDHQQREQSDHRHRDGQMERDQVRVEILGHDHAPDPGLDPDRDRGSHRGPDHPGPTTAPPPGPDRCREHEESHRGGEPAVAPLDDHLPIRSGQQPTEGPVFAERPPVGAPVAASAPPRVPTHDHQEQRRHQRSERHAGEEPVARVSGRGRLGVAHSTRHHRPGRVSGPPHRRIVRSCPYADLGSGRSTVMAPPTASRAEKQESGRRASQSAHQGDRSRFRRPGHTLLPRKVDR